MISSTAACASGAYSPTDATCESGQMPTSRSGWDERFVRIGRPSDTCLASAETTSAGISSATAAATSDLPLAVGPNRAMTSTALGRGERELRAGEGRRRRARDGDRDELAGSRVAAEVDRGVPPRPSTQKLRLGPAGPFDEHLLDHPDASGVPFCGDALHDLDQPLD